jgi:hypothetical protein
LAANAKIATPQPVIAAASTDRSLATPDNVVSGTEARPRRSKVRYGAGSGGIFGLLGWKQIEDKTP